MELLKRDMKGPGEGVKKIAYFSGGRPLSSFMDASISCSISCMDASISCSLTTEELNWNNTDSCYYCWINRL